MYKCIYLLSKVNQDSIYYSFSDSKIAYYNDFKSDMVAN